MTRSAPRPRTSSTCAVSQTAVTLAPRLFRSWTAAEPMAPVAPLTRTCCPLPIFAFRDEREGVVRALGAGSGLLVGHVRRHGRERTVLGDRQVLGVSTEPALAESEHLVADREGRDAAADRLDHSRELIPEDRRPWPDEPAEEPNEEGLARPEAAVRPIHRRRVDLDEHLVVPDRPARRPLRSEPRPAGRTWCERRPSSADQPIR